MSPRYDLPNAAPQPLRVVQEFVNSVDEEHGRELLPDKAALREWLAQRKLGSEPVSLEQALQLRVALRELMLANNGRLPSEEALAIVNEVARGLSPRLDDSGEVTLEGSEPLARLLAIVFAAILDGSWERLKACRNCEWSFYDNSRNRAATWCSMQLCGNRLKTRAYRQRHR